MDYEKIKKDVRKNGYTIKEFSEAIGMSDAGFHKAVREESFNMKTIQKMSEVLKKPVNYFFDDNNNFMFADSEQKTKNELLLEQKVKSLEKVIDGKDRVIKNQNEYIDLLKKGEKKRYKRGENSTVEA